MKVYLLGVITAVALFSFAYGSGKLGFEHGRKPASQGEFTCVTNMDSNFFTLGVRMNQVCDPNRDFSILERESSRTGKVEQSFCCVVK